MAVPKHRTSKMKKRQRRANWRLVTPNMVKCSHCGEYTKPHTVCKACGYYDGKEIVKKEA
ncbi:MAG: 50S ribosomal protein L32 [Clostridia bacterium]|nr:50S ribosomal protein L32 [Clostridia bacterium]